MMKKSGTDTIRDVVADFKAKGGVPTVVPAQGNSFGGREITGVYLGVETPTHVKAQKSDSRPSACKVLRIQCGDAQNETRVTDTVGYVSALTVGKTYRFAVSGNMRSAEIQHIPLALNGRPTEVCVKNTKEVAP